MENGENKGDNVINMITEIVAGIKDFQDALGGSEVVKERIIFDLEGKDASMNRICTALFTKKYGAEWMRSAYKIGMAFMIEAHLKEYGSDTSTNILGL